MGEDAQRTSDLLNLVATLHDNPTLLPSDRVWSSVEQILIIVAITGICQAVILLALRTVGREESSLAPKVSYRLTKLLNNATLAVLGIYHFTQTLPAEPTVQERIVGWEDLKIFSNLQFGCQLWAIPIGHLFADQPTDLIFHHLTTICLFCVTSFFTNGYRYYTPFFYGVIEASSIPLTLINLFKDHPAWIQQYPRSYDAVRVIFAALFLWTRVVMWTPQMYDFLRFRWLLLVTSDSIPAAVIIAVTLMCALVLTCLQLSWALRIIKGLKKNIGGGVGGRKTDLAMARKNTKATSSTLSEEEEEKKID